jgi:hypothetical protein
MLVTASPSGVEELFVSLGVPVTGSEPPTDAVMPPMDELVRLFAGYGCEILGPPLSLSDLSQRREPDRIPTAAPGGHSPARELLLQGLERPQQSWRGSVRRATDGRCCNGANRVAQPLLGWIAVEARVPEHEVLKRFELDGRRDDGERRIIGVSVHEPLVQRRDQVCARQRGGRPGVHRHGDCRASCDAEISQTVAINGCSPSMMSITRCEQRTYSSSVSRSRLASGWSLDITQTQMSSKRSSRLNAAGGAAT